MNEEKKEFETWEEVIVDFFEKKKNSTEEVYLKERLKEIDPNKIKKSKDQTNIEFQRERFRKAMEFNDKSVDFDVELEINKYKEKQKELAEKFEPRRWISENSGKASNVSFATHVIKLTHSAIDASSFFDKTVCRKDDYLTTSILKNKIIDGAVIGNQYAPIYQFLELELDGVKLASTFSLENCDSLNAFSEDKNEMEEWIKGFRNALFEGKVKSHNLAKQVYFPIKYDTDSEATPEYHLLCNIKSSSIAQAIYEKMDDRSSSSKNQRDKKHYIDCCYSLFTSKAILKVTASNHGNASQLNGKRGGRLNLLSCQPPIWQIQIQPPIKDKYLFDHWFYSPKGKENINYLSEYLFRCIRVDLSIKHPKRLKWIKKWIFQITEEFLSYVISIQKLDAGWSDVDDIALKPEHQYLLDPFRQDESFQSARRASDWQQTVCDDFGWWLNKQLRKKDKTFTPQAEHRRLWASLLKKPLRDHNEMVESQRKRQAGVSR